jgi:P27 family predicted phage terminase small subunit
MGKRGPPKKPSALKVVQGTFRKDREAKSPVNVEPKAPKPPKGMSQLGLACWRRMVPKLVAARVLTELDRELLAAFCECWAMYWGLKAVVDEEGWTWVSANGNIRVHPAVGAMKMMLDNVVRLGREFGLTPASRSRIEALPESPTDPTAEFLFG